ncbi:hypothetical protein KCV01_g13577, partial [Aureobasidium melanogenum]
MLALRTSTSLSALGLVLGIAGTSWLTALTYERAPATRPLAEVVMPKALRQSPPAPVVSTVRDEPPPRVVTRPRTPPAETVAAAPKPAPLRAVYMPSPRYPMSALRAHREGQVVLDVTVTPEGDVMGVAVGQTSGDLDLDRAAQDAVRRWRFAAADRPASYTAALPVRFELTETL